LSEIALFGEVRLGGHLRTSFLDELQCDNLAHWVSSVDPYLHAPSALVLEAGCYPQTTIPDRKEVEGDDDVQGLGHHKTIPQSDHAAILNDCTAEGEHSVRDGERAEKSPSLLCLDVWNFG
jgi:hypothetical protein